MKTYKILISILVLVFSAVIFTGCSSEKKYVSYENKNLQFKISVPEDWKKDEKTSEGSDGVIAFGDQSTFSIAITSSEAPEVLPLDEATKGIVQTYTSMPEFKQVSLEKTELGKAPANRFVFTGKQEDQAVKGMIINTAKDNRAYVFVYMATEGDYDANLKDVEEVIKSFEFIK